jgi:uncharacterized RDD family membrane protein YckC
MEREEQLKFCKICTNQKFDRNQGIICGLTLSVAEFKVSCDSFIEDTNLRINYELKLKENEILNKTASQGKRLANYLLDLFFLMVFSIIFGYILGVVIAILSPESFMDFERGNKFIEYLFGFISGMIYFTIFESLTGRTLAKYITKTKVVNVNGENPDFGTIIIRSFFRFIPFEPFSFLGSESSGWHDKLSKTRVIEI